LRCGINNDELLKTIWEHKRKKQKRRKGERGDLEPCPSNKSITFIILINKTTNNL
jgi:hypothetical protein